MVLAQVGTHDQHSLQLGQSRNRCPQPTHAFGCVELRMAQTPVDVVAADAAQQLARQEQLFECAVRTHQGANALCTVLFLDLLQAVGHVFQCGLPVDRLPCTALLDHGLCQAFVAVQRFVRETVAVGNPALVDGFVLERHDAHHLVVLHLDDQVGTGGVMRRHRLATRQLPGTGAVAEGLAGQRTHGAQIDHVARQFGVHGIAHHGGDFRVLTAVDHAQFHDAGHFLAKTHATCAVDAAAHLFHRDQGPHILVSHHALFFFVARTGTAIADRQILQLALTALVANGAIQGVVDQQELHDRLLGLDGLVALGAHDHALRDRGRAGRQGFGGLFHFHQTHAAIGSNGKFLVVAKVRNVGASSLGRMHDHAARSNLHLLAV